MGNTVGTVYWNSNENDSCYLLTFQRWSRQELITYDSHYCSMGQNKLGQTKFSVELGGFARDSKKIRKFITHCAEALKMHGVKGVRTEMDELPM